MMPENQSETDVNDQPPVVVDILLPILKADNEAVQKREIADKLGVPESKIQEFRLVKHSIDARKRTIKAQLRFEVGLGHSLPPEPDFLPHYPELKADAPRVIIVGCGPAGMFAALNCIQNGLKPIVLERGKDASSRRRDLAPILRHGTIVEDSNYCFGEGGAGTFSDGKLYTRASKRGSIRDVYETFVSHGAPKRILVDAHPHIGSNLLPKVVMAMRESILKAGGEVHFLQKVSQLIIEGGRAHGAVTADGRSFEGVAVVLATGHSARDIYSMLHQQGLRLEQKPFAVGVRIEHPQAIIDRLQYHLKPDQSRPHLLPAASYHVATKIRGRGVHSFCMCPGGFIVPAATQNDEVVVNGMSLSRRDSPFANSGLVVTVEPEDTAKYQKEHGVLAGVAFQKVLEQAAKAAGGGGQVAPGQRVIDFMEKRNSQTLPDTSYFPGLNAARIDEMLPSFIVDRMTVGLNVFGKKMPGFISDDVNLVGFETRTSAPVRIPRNREDLQHPEVKGLYPCAEGAGFAGGIVSAALDGIRCAEAIKLAQ